MAKSAIIVNGFQNLKHDMEPDRLTPKVTELETTTSGVYYFTKYRKKKYNSDGKRKISRHDSLACSCFSRLPRLWLNYIVKISLVDLSYLFYTEIEPLGILAHILN